MHIVSRDYQGHAIAYQDDGWFNATQAASKFGKVPHDWLRLPAHQTASPALARQLHGIDPSARLQDLRPKDWMDIWPELIGTPSAPAVAEPAKEGA